MMYNNGMNMMYLIFSFNIGGIERLLVDLCNETARRGHHVTLCVINEDTTPSILETLDPAVEQLFLHRPMGQGAKLPYMHALSREISKRHIDILHCQGINCVLFAALAKLAQPHLVVLNTVHDSGNYPSYSAIKIFLQNRICNHTIAISDSVRNEILARGIRPEQVTTIYNAIDTAKFQILYDHNLAPTDHIELGNVARFFPAKKGQDTLVKAVELLKTSYPHIHCSFAGDVFKGQQDAYYELQEYVRSHDLTDNITFLGNVGDIPSFLHSLDIFVLPSNYEGFGIALIEALSCGIPVIASALQGPEEIFSLAGDLRIGRTCPAGDADALAAAIADVIEQRDTFSPAALHDYVEQHFSKDIATDQHLALYQRLLQTR